MATTVSHPIPTAQAHAIADLTGYEDAATLHWQQACVQAANTLTALPNGRYVNVRMERMRQGLELAQRGAVTQTWPRHPCQQWGLKTTGCARVPDRVLTSRTRLGMLCCITYCSDCSFQRKTSCRVKSRRVRVSSVSASLMS